ncbi:MAG: hypothetical protein KBD64_06950 [Gammaproteobacteria bacterium]|nr:hypothetical protein [Gammaproteobacteria bacterium]
MSDIYVIHHNPLRAFKVRNTTGRTTLRTIKEKYDQALIKYKCFSAVVYSFVVNSEDSTYGNLIPDDNPSLPLWSFLPRGRARIFLFVLNRVPSVYVAPRIDLVKYYPRYYEHITLRDLQVHDIDISEGTGWCSHHRPRSCSAVSSRPAYTPVHRSGAATPHSFSTHTEPCLMPPASFIPSICVTGSHQAPFSSVSFVSSSFSQIPPPRSVLGSAAALPTIPAFPTMIRSKSALDLMIALSESLTPPTFDIPLQVSPTFIPPTIRPTYTNSVSSVGRFFYPVVSAVASYASSEAGASTECDSRSPSRCDGDASIDRELSGLLVPHTLLSPGARPS